MDAETIFDLATKANRVCYGEFLGGGTPASFGGSREDSVHGRRMTIVRRIITNGGRDGYQSKEWTETKIHYHALIEGKEIPLDMVTQYLDEEFGFLHQEVEAEKIRLEKEEAEKKAAAIAAAHERAEKAAKEAVVLKREQEETVRRIFGK